jgi:Holliday junction resolvase RusA-like endonuclease
MRALREKDMAMTDWISVCAFDVQGEPKGQPRPRAFYNKKAGRASVYDKGTAEGWKGAIALAARPFLPLSPLSGPLRLTVAFFFPRPARLMRKKDPESYIPHTAKPDADNALKAVMDCLTQIGMWTDDQAVSSVAVEKNYCAKASRPGAAIQIFKKED